MPISERSRPAKGTKEIDGTGMYLMPGFVDAHVHCGGGQAHDPEYVYKLWLAHGVTTVRGVPCGSMDWDLRQRELSAKNQIVAPRIFAYHRPFTRRGLGPHAGRRRPRRRASGCALPRKKGVDGLKLGAHDPEIMAALLDEAKKLGLGSTAHLDQMGVVRMTARDASRLGLGAMTHYYGLFESLLKDTSIQPYPVNQNYNDEQHRFGQVARLWDKIHPRGSEQWNALIKEWVDAEFIIDPTMTIYSAGRDVMRMRNADWHDKYTLPSLWDFYQPNRDAHGSYWFDWTTEDEVAWKKFYQVWMAFLNDYKNAGGRVTTGSDSGFIYQTYGFGYILELEMLQEAGFHPLEVIRSATLYGAAGAARAEGQADRVRHHPSGPARRSRDRRAEPARRISRCCTSPARCAQRCDRQARARRRHQSTSIKDGIVYDAKKLAADVAAHGRGAKRRAGDNGGAAIRR